MEDLKSRIIIPIITTILGGSISGIGTWLQRDNHWAKRVEVITAKATRLEIAVNEQIKELVILNENNANLSKNLNLLQTEFNELEQKYERCISSYGMVTVVESLDFNSYERQFNTGDHLEFKLTSSSLVVSFIRVSNRGPIISISGCDNYITDNSVQLSDNDYYLLSLDNTIKIRFTSKSCETNSAIEPSELEGIKLTVLEFNVSDQIFTIQYSRTI